MASICDWFLFCRWFTSSFLPMSLPFSPYQQSALWLWHHVKDLPRVVLQFSSLTWEAFLVVCRSVYWPMKECHNAHSIPWIIIYHSIGRAIQNSATVHDLDLGGFAHCTLSSLLLRRYIRFSECFANARTVGGARTQRLWS